MCSCCHLHTQFYCENGGGVYGRINIIDNNLSIILWINRCNYHKYCLNYNFSYYFEQIIKRHICSKETSKSCTWQTDDIGRRLQSLARTVSTNISSSLFLKPATRESKAEEEQGSICNRSRALSSGYVFNLLYRSSLVIL